MDRLLNGAKLPKMDALKTEGRELASRKKAAYAEHRAAKANIDHLLGLMDAQKNKEMER